MFFGGRAKRNLLASCALLAATATALRGQVVPPTSEQPPRSTPERNRSSDSATAVVTRQTLFSIPFAVEEQPKSPREIRLYVSGNRGRRWVLYQKRPAAGRKFDFQAGRDGEYWFAVATDTVPRKITQDTRPEKIVIVDTDRPRVDLKVSVLQEGRLSARWYASDPTLSPGTFRLSYRTDESSDWKKIDVILPRESSAEFDGEVSWQVHDEGTIYVRAEIMDRAGNVGSIVRDIPVQHSGISDTSQDYGNDLAESNEPLQDTATENRDQSEPASELAWKSNQENSWNANTPENDAKDSPEPQNNADDSALPNDNATAGNFVGHRETLPDAPLGDDAARVDDWQARNQEEDGRPKTRYTRWSSDDALPVDSDRPLASEHQDRFPSLIPNDAEYERPSRLDSRFRNRPVRREDPGPDAASGKPHGTAASEPNDSLSESAANVDDGYLNDSSDYQLDEPGDFNAAEANSETRATFSDELKTTEDPYAPPPQDDGPPTQVTNSRAFNLEYDVDDLGSTNLARVELWVTTNGGHNWSSYGTDDDLTSPFYVEVENEGTYGFQLLIHSTEGQSTAPPQDGDAPEISIEVDTTKPVAFLRDAFVERDNPEVMSIEWNATDRNLSAGSITLSYAETLNGPWVVIANDVKNTGRYRWQMPEQLPRAVNIQIDVVDDGGNRTVHQLQQPTATRSTSPKARIKAIRSADE
ncbi:MAG: hypothetical protein KDB27_26060 [Planctomycetales bacterium]|nr:hypothetical protein [Planctomycetales bacterium]